MKLRTKLFIFALPVYLVVVVVMTSLAQSGVRTLVEQGEYRRGLGVALGVAQNEDAIGGFHASSENRLLKHLQGIQEHAQALYAVALSPSGRVLAHTNVAEVGKTYGPAQIRYPRLQPGCHWRAARDGFGRPRNSGRGRRFRSVFADGSGH